MDVNENKNKISLLVLLAIIVTAQSTSTFDVRNFGGKPNGDISQALVQAWKGACASPSPAKVYVPAGIFTVTKAFFLGPCKAPVEFQLVGTLRAPSSASGFKDGDGWVTFERIDKLTVFGGGVFDGNGEAAWGKHCDRLKYCSKLPINLRFNFVTNSVIKSVTSLDSKQFHIMVLGGEGLTFRNLKIIAPEDSYNTDGIHIGRSNNINITDSYIGTGDDCISVGDGTTRLSVTKVTCGPGHGISIGSLGKYVKEAPVEGIIVRNCTFKGTSNGVRVKTWPDSHEMAASDMHFRDLIMENVDFPVLIDQEYCPWNQCNLKKPSKVKLNKISFKNIRGSSRMAEAVKLVCSGGYPCQNVEVGSIDLKYSGREGPAKFICKNVKPRITGYVNPPACTSTASSSPSSSSNTHTNADTY